MTVRPTLLLAAALLLGPGFVHAQNQCPDGGIGSAVFSFELDSATGNNAHLGVEVVGGEYFVTSRGPGAIPPHKVYVLDSGGNLLRSFDQPAATSSSPWGMRDLATDGTNLFGGDENGVYGFSPQGVAVNQVIAANGARTLGNLSGSAAEQLLGTIRGLAFDRAGNGGEGSFWSANFSSDLVEFDLSGNVLNRFTNTTGWSIYGLALDTCSGTLWAYAAPSGGDIVELSRATGQPTGRALLAGGVEGGLAIFPAPGGIQTWFARLDQTGPDAVHVGVLRQVPGVCDGLELYSQVDSGPADRSFKQLGAAAQTLTLGTRGAPLNAPTAYFFNLGPDALVCGDVSYLGPSWQALADLVVAFGISQPAGIAIDVTLASGVPFTLQTSVFPSASIEPMRVQAVWLDARVPGSYVPVIATNEVELLVDRRPPLGIVCEARGPNSFNQDPSNGFFSVTNPASAAISRIKLEAVGGMVFDFAQVGMADRFDGGNSTQAGCLGTFRNGSDVTAGVDYASNPVSPCDPNARQAHRETGSNGPVVTIPFTGSLFRSNVKAEWDLDTDGGPGVTGAAMGGMRITLDFANGDRRVGTLAVDPNIRDRAFVIL